ncbi:MAG: family N-acetyltransferase [Microbacteriaceae bacterium]|jgi:ElaA protein|nr:family N-acetyltransferase [Microbacteriaceae bacterium]
MPECSVVRKSWSELTTDELYAFIKLRTDVFFVEQKVDEEELDNRDQEPTTEHLWIADAEGTAAYLRVLVDPQPEHRDATHLIGRVVVRADRRGEGLSQALIRAVLDSYPGTPFLLHSQEYIAPLYAKFGFAAFGDSYVEAGIPHIMMYRAAA